MLKSRFHQNENEQVRSNYTVFESGNYYYQFLNDLKFDENEGCDYCTAFMFV